MRDLSSTASDHFNNDEYRSFNRLLKRLKIALFIWLLFFLATVIWFSAAGF